MAARKAPARKAAVRRPARAAPRDARVVSDGAVLRATGREWDEWLKLLDRAGARLMTHREIALLLSKRFEVSGWWCQMVTVGYERARGLRAVNQRADGFAANASRTVAVGVKALFEAWSDPRVRARWLKDAPVEVRRATDGKSMRMAWTVGDSRVAVGFFPKGPHKSSVQVEHGRLPSAAVVARQKAYWSEALDRLKALLEPAAKA